MRTKWLVASILILLSCYLAPLGAQQDPIVQWEYLVVSFGRTSFLDPDVSPVLKEVGLSKVISFSKAGLLSAGESIELQTKMDTLGRFGWELVSIVGAIAGDQQLVFKRRFDAARSQKESEQIRIEGKRLATAAMAEKAKNESQAVLINLDEVEAEKKKTDYSKQVEDLVKKGIQRVTEPYKVASVSIRPSISYSERDKQATVKGVAADVVVDVTAPLVNAEGKYRGSEAEALAKKLARETEAELRLREGKGESRARTLFGTVMIHFHLTVNYGGKTWNVGSASSIGNLPAEP